MSILDRVLTLIRDDSYAASFQSLGQYRAALLRAADGEVPEGRPQAAGVPAINLLAPTHKGMRVDAFGILGRIRDGRYFQGLKFGCGEMLRHLEELATRYYAGDITVIDEFLQLYCLDNDRPKAVERAAVEELLTTQGVPMGAWAVLASNGSIRAWSDRRDHPTLVKLEEEGATVVQLAWPLLDAPALIGGAVVGKGCSTGTVVAIAKRQYQYETEHSPEEHARREQAFRAALAQVHKGLPPATPVEHGGAA